MLKIRVLIVTGVKLSCKHNVFQKIEIFLLEGFFLMRREDMSKYNLLF